MFYEARYVNLVEITGHVLMLVCHFVLLFSGTFGCPAVVTTHAVLTE